MHTRPSQGELGLVVIGRNEGERLVRCLASLAGFAGPKCYVDSGSRDASVARANNAGLLVVELDPREPFTAARARNAGLQALLAQVPELQWVQFLDGDCVLAAGWLDAARTALAEPGVVVVFGQRRELHPDATPYNLLANLEWQVPPGDALTCGGDAMMRVAALRDVGGYDASLIAGEEPDLCRRLRARGGRIRCLPVRMSNHDAQLLHFAQWWRRAVRTGYVEAQGLARHGFAYPRARAALSTWFWTLGLWCGAVLLAIVLPRIGFSPPASAAAATGLWALLHVGQWWRIARRRRDVWSRAERCLFASACMASKWAGLVGAWVFAWRSCFARRTRLLEYK